jgi:phage-related minor tail protein
MNRKLLLLLASATLTFSTATFAHKDAANHSHTVMESLTELKDSLKDTAKAGIEKFSEKASDVYGKLSTQIDEMFHNSKDKKDAKIDSLKLERDDLKKELDNYDKTEEGKTEEMRRNLVKKLEELNEKITDYNKSIKK